LVIVPAKCVVHAICQGTGKRREERRGGEAIGGKEKKGEGGGPLQVGSGSTPLHKSQEKFTRD